LLIVRITRSFSPTLVFILARDHCKIICWELDVRGSMYHSTIHTEKSNKMQHCIKIYYSIFIRSSTSFGRRTAHHQEPKTALAVSGLHTWKVVGCVVAGRCQVEYEKVQAPSHTLPDSVQQPHVQQPSTYANQRLLMQF